MAEKSFDEWKWEVNREVEKSVGLSCDDLPDIPYYDLFVAGESPRAAANYAIRYAQDEEV